MSDRVGILVADDEPGMRETLVDILSDSGYRVCAAPDGDAALAAIKLKPFHVVVMDIKMPGRDGVAVLREVGDPPPRVILMTAYASPEMLEQARAANAFAIVKKPFVVPELLGLVAGAAEAVE
jgi:two-component system, NtrC family, response regulator AtoC